MKRILTVLLLMSAGLSIGKLSAQQIPQFSQYMFNGLYINPAYAGYKGDLYAHLMYRKQWMGVDGTPQTVMLGVDADLGRGSNMGLVFTNDQIGVTTNTSIMLNYAYRFPVSEEGRLAFGLAAGAVYYGLDKAKSTPDPLIAATENVWKPQVDVGAYLDWPDFYAGFSVMGLISNKADTGSMQIMRADPTFFLTGGGMIHIDETWAIAPSTMLKTDFKSPISVDITAMGVYAETFWLGLSYRTGLNFTYDYKKLESESLKQQNALVILAEVYVLENLRIGAAYDFNLMAISKAYSGGLEVSIGYYITKLTRKYVTPRYF